MAMIKTIKTKLFGCWLAIMLVYLKMNATFALGPLVPGAGNEGCNCQLTDDKISSACKQYCSGKYQISDFLQIGIKFSQIILGLVGALVLLFFVYGGVMFIISGGSSDRVNQAKRIITGSVIGLAIVFLSYTIIYFVATTLGYNGDIFSTI